MSRVTSSLSMCAAATAILAVGVAAVADHGTPSHTSKMFKGAKANTGTVTHSFTDGRDVLTLSDDFKTPDTPAPHWQVVDSRGDVYLLQRLMIKGEMGKGDRLNRSITLPAYIPDVARVQIWCAWAETLLGETTFDEVIVLGGPHDMSTHVSSRFKGPKANTGTVSHTHEGGKSMLVLSEDFVIPDTPAPHWQIVDSRGNAYLLQRLAIKDNKVNRAIIVPAYVPDVARVQIWCAWAETLLGEASFERPVK